MIDLFATDSLFVKDRNKLMEIEKQKEIAAIQDYLKKNNITGVQQTAKGDFYLITEHGNGPKADTGKKVSVSYNGYSLDGKYFDSNIDSMKQIQKHPLDPFRCVILVAEVQFPECLMLQLNSAREIKGKFLYQV